MGKTPVVAFFGASIILTLGATPVRANRESNALRARAGIEIYNLDRERAIETFRQAIAADPQDPAAYRGLAGATWLGITFDRGIMTVDEYMGRVTRNARTPPPPPSETATAFREALDRSLWLARKRVEANPRDADAHYQIGASVALRASYVATVEGRTLGAFRAAREAYDEHEKVLSLDPSRKDAGLIVGTYRYVVSALSLPARWMAYMVGFGGGRERGIHMIEEAAVYPGENQSDAQIALVLLYNREQRFDPALKVLAQMQQQFPRNRLLWLEMGATYLRARRPADALRVLDEGIVRFEADHRPKMFGETALWYYKRGTSRAALGQSEQADQDLRQAVAAEGRQWVHGRAQLEIGKLLLKSGNRSGAREALQAAATLCDADNDGAAADEARRLLN